MTNPFEISSPSGKDKAIISLDDIVTVGWFMCDDSRCSMIYHYMVTVKYRGDLNVPRKQFMEVLEKLGLTMEVPEEKTREIAQCINGVN